MYYLALGNIHKSAIYDQTTFLAILHPKFPELWSHSFLYIPTYFGRHLWMFP